MNNIYVVNKNNHAPTDNDFYIGRGSVLGNPYTSKDVNNSKAIYQAKSKDDAIELYETYLENRIKNNDISVVTEINKMLGLLKDNDIYLVCYCSPKKCHGDVIKAHLLSNQMRSLMNKITKT